MTERIGGDGNGADPNGFNLGSLIKWRSTRTALGESMFMSLSGQVRQRTPIHKVSRGNLITKPASSAHQHRNRQAMKSTQQTRSETWA